MVAKRITENIHQAGVRSSWSTLYGDRGHFRLGHPVRGRLSRGDSLRLPPPPHRSAVCQGIVYKTERTGARDRVGAPDVVHGCEPASGGGMKPLRNNGEASSAVRGAEK